MGTRRALRFGSLLILTATAVGMPAFAGPPAIPAQYGYVTSLSAPGDFDGDGLTDLLTTEYREPETRAVARKGTNGSVLWTKAGKVFEFAAMGGRVGPAAEPGAIIITEAWTVVGLAGTSTVTIQAVRGNGTPVWSRTFTAAAAGSPVVLQGAGAGVAVVQGTLQANAHPATDVLVKVLDYAGGGGYFAPHSARVAFEILDGATGASFGRSEYLTLGYDFSGWNTGDLSGDGLEDYLVTPYSAGYPLPGGHRAEPAAFSARRGTDGSLLWAKEDGRTGRYINLGDVTGDERGELLIQAYDTSAGSIILDGATGQTLWTTTGTVAGIGDVDGDGTGDVGILKSASSFVHAAAKGTDGTPIYEHEYVPAFPSAPNRRRYASRFIGDVDGDGVTDIAHGHEVYDEQGTLVAAERGAFSGKTDERLWDGWPGLPVYGTFDGAGDDLVDFMSGGEYGSGSITAQDGRTGVTSWQRTVFAEEWSPRGAEDLTGDGRVELFSSTSDGIELEVIDGATGQRLWVLCQLYYECPDHDA